MSMRTCSKYVTVCEVFRLINDMCQDNSGKDSRIRELCVLGQMIGKRLSLCVSKEKTVEIAEKGPFNLQYEEVIRKRTRLGFKDEWHRREEIKEEYGMEE